MGLALVRQLLSSTGGAASDAAFACGMIMCRVGLFRGDRRGGRAGIGKGVDVAENAVFVVVCVHIIKQCGRI